MQYNIEQLRHPSLKQSIDTHRPEVQASATFILNYLRTTYPDITSHQLSEKNPPKGLPFFTQQTFLQGQLKLIINALAKNTDLVNIRQKHRFQPHMKKLSCIAGTLEMMSEVLNLPDYSHEMLLLIFKEIQHLAHKYTTSPTWNLDDEHWSSDVYYDAELGANVAVKATHAELLNLVCTALLDASHYPKQKQASSATPTSLVSAACATSIESVPARLDPANQSQDLMIDSAIDLNKQLTDERTSRLIKFTALLHRNAQEQQQGKFEKCATGHKHDLLTLLDKTYTDQQGALIELIMDIPSFLHQTFTVILEPALSSLPQALQYDFLLNWMRVFYEEPDNLSSLIMPESLRQTITEALITRIHQKGLIVSQETIHNFLNNWMYAPIPVDKPLVHLLTLLFEMEPPALGNHALQALKKRLSGDFIKALEQQAHIPNLKTFYDILRRTRLIKKYERLVPFTAIDQQFITTRNVLKQQLEQYFENICVVEDDIPACTAELDASMQAFSTHLQALEKDQHMELMQTFFIAITHNPQWIQLINDCFNNPPEQNPLFVDEAILTDWLTTYTNREHITEISAYEINRMFINALFNPDHRWSGVFQEAIRLMTTWLFESKHSDHHSTRALAAVYPIPLLQHLLLLSLLPEPLRMKEHARYKRLEGCEYVNNYTTWFNLLHSLDKDECINVLSLIEPYIQWFNMGMDHYSWRGILKLLRDPSKEYTDQQYEQIVKVMQRLQYPGFTISEMINILENPRISSQQWNLTLQLIQQHIHDVSDFKALLTNPSFSPEQRNSIYQTISPRLVLTDELMVGATNGLELADALLIRTYDLESLLSIQNLTAEQHTHLFNTIKPRSIDNGADLYTLLAIPTLSSLERDEILSVFKPRCRVYHTQLIRLLSIEPLTLLQKRTLLSLYATGLNDIGQVTGLLSYSEWSTQERDLILQILLPHMSDLIHNKYNLYEVLSIKNLIPEQRDTLFLALLPTYCNVMPEVSFANVLFADKTLDSNVLDQLFSTLQTSKFAENSAFIGLLFNEDLSANQQKILWNIVKLKLDTMITSPKLLIKMVSRPAMTNDDHTTLWQFAQNRLSQWMGCRSQWMGCSSSAFYQLGSAPQLNRYPDFQASFWQAANACSDNWLLSVRDLAFLLSDSNTIPHSLETIWAIAKPRLGALMNHDLFLPKGRAMHALFSVQVSQIPDYYTSLWSLAKPELATLSTSELLSLLSIPAPIPDYNSTLWQLIEPKLTELYSFDLEKMLISAQLTPQQRQQLIALTADDAFPMTFTALRCLTKDERISIWPKLLKQCRSSLNAIENLLALPDLDLDEQQRVLSYVNQSYTRIEHLVTYLKGCSNQAIGSRILQKTMPNVLKYGEDYLSDLLCCDRLSHENKTILIEAFASELKEKLPNAISQEVFTKKSLTPAQINTLVRSANALTLQGWMSNTNVMETLLSIDDPDIQGRVFDVARTILSRIDTPQHLISLLSLKTLSAAQQNCIWESCHYVHSQMQTDDFLALFANPTLNEELKTVILKQHPWELCIKNSAQWCAFLSLPTLSPNELEEMIAALAPKMSDLIVYCSELTQLVSIPHLTEAQRDFFLETYAAKLQKPSLSPFRVAALLSVETLTSKQRTFITEKIAPQKAQLMAPNASLSFFSAQADLELKDDTVPVPIALS